MKKFIYSLGLSALMFVAVKTSAQSVTYNYIKNNPYDIKNLSFAIDPLFVDFNGHNGYAFGWGARLEHMMGKTLLLNYDMKTGFGTKDYRKSNDNTRNYFNMEGGLGLIFVNKERNVNCKIVLSSSTSGNYRYTKYITVPAKSRLLVALRGGFVQYTNTLNYKNLSDSLLTFNGKSYKEAKAAGSYVFTDTINKVNGQNAIVDQIGGIAFTSIYGGIQFRTIRDLVLDVDGYGYRSNSRYSDFFIDVMFAPVLSIKDFKNTDGTKYDVKYTDLSRLGWRLGWFWRKPKDQGFSAKFEFGSRPGFKSPVKTNIPVNKTNLYASLTFGLYIPLKVKPFYNGEND